MLEKVTDRRVRKSLLDRADTLVAEPERKGKALVGELAGYRSLRAVGQRYRIVYEVDEPSKVVHIVAAALRRQGSKRDVYELLTRVFGRPSGGS
jgi:mRNA interferase RelE/StbE